MALKQTEKHALVITFSKLEIKFWTLFELYAGSK